jgi:hypothetical protein
MSEQGSLSKAVINLVEAELRIAKIVIGAIAGKSSHDCKDHSGSHDCDCKRFSSRPLTHCTYPCDARGCSCRIPTPCWLPEDLGDCAVIAEPCGGAKLRIVIRNTDGISRTMSVAVTGTGHQFVTVSGSPATVPAFGTAAFDLSVAIPSQTPAGPYVDVKIWILGGCREHVLGWRVDVGKCAHGSDHEIIVCDGANFIHHWYDHFYCPRPCHHQPVKAA